ncbi:ABC transporter permease [Effusibacillus lacus]|uniref:Multidrug transporter n=1 Tax=Effusibacillus lacus TaxID=1348429 RepID=A0A292YN47_9BACL|nr:ABC-2 family transporter protein [Effusibacillus lacus]TCS71273.1 ABC-2 type transport system permease protein [Effusibacillus lacus]GAX89900.1 multidrug transporter [Effusibacillus lacus]
MSGIIRHIRILREFLRAAIVEEMEYRSQFVSNLLTTLFGVAMAVLTVQVFFYQTGSLGGWGFYEVLILLGIFNVLQGFVDMVLRPNIGRIVQHIRKGTLDFILTKPVDSQFFISFRHIVIWKVFDILMGFLIVGVGIYGAGLPLEPVGVLLFLVLMLASVVTLYSLWIGVMTLSFWFVKVENISFLFSSFFETGRYPVQLYRGWLRFLLTYVFPVAVMTTFPAASLIGKLEPSQVLVSAGVAVLTFSLTRLFWKRALRFYTSASS